MFISKKGSNGIFTFPLKKKKRKKIDKYSEEWIVWSPFQYLSYQKLC